MVQDKIEAIFDEIQRSNMSKLEQMENLFIGRMGRS